MLKRLVNRFLGLALESLSVSAERVRAALVRSSQVGEVTLGTELWNRSRSASADWVLKNASRSLIFLDSETDGVNQSSGDRIRLHALKSLCVSECHGNQLILEFGVWKGKSLDFFDKNTGGDTTLFGFDSFEGLSSDWAGNSMPAGTFSTSGVVPKFDGNVTIEKGDVRKTFPIWLEKNDIRGYCHRLLHLDMDLYDPTYSVLKAVSSHLREGDLILLDNALSYPGFEAGELAALEDSGISTEPLALTGTSRHGGSDKLLVRVRG